MVYIHFHEKLPTFNQSKLKDWLAAPSKDWTHLRYWLAQHQLENYPTNFSNENEAAIKLQHEITLKCWYSECDLQGYKDTDIEHYRPKNSVEAPPQLDRIEKILGYKPTFCDFSAANGYKWLEFQPKNYRLSHAIVNQVNNTSRGGKGETFPIKLGTNRLQDNSGSQETPVLLDPCKKGDPDLLQFLDDGTIQPRYTNGWERERAAVSIVVYSLDYIDFKIRRKNAYKSVLNEIKRLNHAVDTKDASAIKQSKDALSKLIKRNALFAAAARAAITNHADYPDGDDIKYAAVVLHKILEFESQDPITP